MGLEIIETMGLMDPGPKPEHKVTPEIIDYLNAHPAYIEELELYIRQEKEASEVDSDGFHEKFDEAYKKIFGRRPRYKVWSQDRHGQIGYMAQINFKTGSGESYESELSSAERGLGLSEEAAKDAAARKAYWSIKGSNTGGWGRVR